MLDVAPLDNFVSHAPPGAGTGRVRIARFGGRSVVVSARATSPLKLLLPGNHGRAAWIFTSTYGGGLVDGDAVALDVGVGRGALALLSTQASTKVYRSPHGTSATTRARVADGGLLVILPDPVVCFAASSYDQRQDIDLDRDGSAVCLDWVTSGRRARGERWAFDEYRSRLQVRSAGRPICLDAMRVSAADGDLVERFGRFDVLATLVLAGPAIQEGAAAARVRAAALPVVRRPDLVVAASPLGDAGALVRAAGPSVETVGGAIRDLLSFLPAVLGDDPWRRKW